MYRVWGRASSSNVQALLWGMEEMGLAYERVDVGEAYGGLDTSDFRAMTPHRRIPVLELPEGGALWETGAVLRYLAVAHGFGSVDPLERARVDTWAEWAKYEVAGAFTGPVFWRAVRTVPAARDEATIDAALARFEQALAVGATELKPYLCGAALTLADIQFGHVLYRYFDTGLARNVPAGIEDYYALLCERAAYQKTVMVSYEALKNTFGERHDDEHA